MKKDLELIKIILNTLEEKRPREVIHSRELDDEDEPLSQFPQEKVAYYISYFMRRVILKQRAHVGWVKVDLTG